MPNMNYEEVQFTVEQELGTLPSKGRWKKKVRFIKWGDRQTEAKLDIRPWSNDDFQWGKGLTFTRDELIELKKILDSVEL